MIASRVFEEPIASELTASRIGARSKRRLTYDCMNAIVAGDRVKCQRGYAFKVPGRGASTGLSLLSVLRGRCSQVCQRCKDYDGEETE